MSSNSNLSTFVFDDEELVIYPGSRFSKQELKARLKEMGINYNNNQDREYLKNLYDSAITDYKNRVSIIHRIKRDTEILNSKMNQSQKQSILSNSNINNYSNDSGKSKLMNLSYDIDKIYQNANNNYYQNFIQQKNNERQNYNKGFNNNNIINQNQNNINNYNRNIEYNRKEDSNDYFNNNNNNSFNNKQYEEINTNIDENNYNGNNNKKAKDYDYNQYQYKNQDNTNKNIMNKPYMLKRNKNMFTIPESQYENDSEEYNNNINNNINNYNYQRNYNKIDIIPQKNILKNNNIQAQPYQSNTPINSQNPEYNNINNKNNKNREINNRPSFLNNLNKGISKYDTKSDENEENNNNSKDNTNKNSNNDNNIEEKDESIKVKKSPDEVSTFSFFSAFTNIKKTPLIKNWKFILIHLLILLSILILSVSFLHIIYNNRESINTFISSIFQALCQPRLIIESIRNFIYYLFFGSLHYWYVILPLLILGFVFYFYVKKYLLKKRCEEIKEKIVEDLKKEESGRISQDDIYNKYVKKYGVSYSTFIKKYLQRLEKLRKADHRLKKSSMIFKEKTFVFWELSE